MPTAQAAHKVAEAHFITSWDEAIALERQLSLLRQVAKERYNEVHLQMHFVKPWGGPNHTEFWLVAQVATAAMAAEMKRWLLRQGQDFLKEYRKNPTLFRKPPLGRPRRVR